MEVYWAIGAAIFYMTFFFSRRLLRFNTKTYFHFLKYFLIGSAISIGLRLLLGSFPPLPTSSYGTLMMVWWEDLVFSLALIYLPQFYLQKKIAIPITIVASVIFASGHINQGYLWAFITLLYPYFISYKSAKQYGYGTVMALHVTYDVMVVSTIHLLHYLKAYV